MSEERKFRVVGTRPIRHDGVEKVTGKANFGADLAFPDMLWGRILRSPHAHAKIVRIDTSKAEALPGVKAVVTSADFPDHPKDRGEMWDMTRNVMAREKVLYDGHAIAAVAATTQRIAAAALELIDVEYEVLRPVMNLDQAIAPDAPILHEGMVCEGHDPKPKGVSNVAQRMQIGRGDVEKGFAAADVIVEREFTTETAHQGYIEPFSCVVRANADGQVVIWCCTQGPFNVRASCARLTGMDVSQIKVIPSEIGGGFGGKTTVYQEPVAVMLARKSGRPVKMTMSRQEVFRATGPTSASRVRVKIGATKDGKITAAHASLQYEAGAFKGSPMMPGVMCIFAMYDLENVFIEGYDIVVNKPKVNAYRAPGAPMSTYAGECVLDEIAEKLSIDPIDLRIANAVKEGSMAVYGPKFKAIGLVECLESLRDHPHYRQALAPGQGRGVAAGFWFNANMQSSAQVNLNEDGSATVMSGCPDIGGSRASLAIMAAEELGLPVEKIRPIVADTESIGYNDGTGGSRVTYATGTAVINACRDIVQQLRERAALLWETDVENVAWEEGRAVPLAGAGEGKTPLTIKELARGSARTGGPISGRSSWTARGNGPSFGAHVCDVEVDRETGQVKVLRYTAAQDAGRAIHPSYVEGQIQGGSVQGIGWALNEEYVYGADGRLQNASFLDYRMPVASDLPMIDAVVVEVPNPHHPYGVRGVGETGIVPALAAVSNAVSHAAGVRFTHLPLSPPAVLAGIEKGA